MTKWLSNTFVHAFAVVALTSCSDILETNPIKTIEIYSGQYRQLIKAANRRDTVEMKRIINSNHLELDYADPSKGLSLLNWCIINRKAEGFRVLLESGADPNWQETALFNFAPPITEAAEVDDASIYLELALANGGDVNLFSNKPVPTTADMTPLYGAIFSSRLENVRLLIEKGCDVNLAIDSMPTPLAETIIQGKIEMTKCLLGKGADYRNMQCWTIKAVLDEHDRSILDNNGSPISQLDKKLNVLDLLRMNRFPLNSERHKIKMEIVAFLQSKGMDYWSHPIPDEIKNQYKGDPEYLLKY